MHIQYLAHSGFFIECADCIYIFDYYQGALPQSSADKPVAVFASHSHRDHYNPEIFTLLKNNGAKNITAVLAKDIKSHHYPPNIPVIKAYAHQSYRVGSAQIDTLLSTDSGVAFVLHTNEGTVYHAGDLNDWQWPEKGAQYNKQMTGSYRHEINLLKNVPIDCAFLPLDPHLGTFYAYGLIYFLETVHPKHFYPMHFWQDENIISTFLEQYPIYSNIICLPEQVQII